MSTPTNNCKIDINELLGDVITVDSTANNSFGFTSRRLTEIGPELCKIGISDDKISELSDEIIRLGQNLRPTQAQVLPCESAAAALSESIQLPPVLIDGLLYRGDIMSVNSPSKAGKSFFLLNLAICLALGETWLNFLTMKSKILYLNFEIGDALFRYRIMKICEAMNFDHNLLGNLHFYSARGHVSEAYTPIRDILSALINSVKSENYDVIIIDPLYKLYSLAGNIDENSNSDMARLFEKLDELCIKTGTTVIFSHHYAKGIAARKNLIDRSSGAGVLARYPDAILNMTELDTPGTMPAYRLEPILRNWPSDWTVDVRWDWPLHIIANDLAKCELKSKPGRPGGSNISESQIEAAWIECCDDSGVASITNMKKYLGFGSYGTFFRIVKSMSDNPYELTVSKTEIRGKKSDKKIISEDIFSDIEVLK